jgi:hypothetical protein
VSDRVPTTALFEVRCHRCNVSFPIGTKVCLHCGGRTGEPAAPVLLSEIRALSRPDGDGAPLLSQDGELAEAPAGDEAEPGRRSLFGTAMSLFWVLLLVGGYFFRSCVSEPQ